MTEPVPGPSVPVGERAGAEPAVAAAPVLAIAGSVLGRARFLTTLRGALEAMIEEESRGTGGTAADCPWLSTYLATFVVRSGEEWLTVLRRWVGAEAERLEEDALLAAIVARARVGVRAWRETGALPAGLPGVAEAAAGPVVQRFASGPGSAGAVDPAGVRAALGPGRPLEAGVRHRMAAALGGPVEDVRVHADARSAALASRLGARAFTVDGHVAFAAGQYLPGTLAGDALLAHELAHTQQQARGGSGATEAELESEADAAAIGAVAGRPRPVARGARGLRLQRCGETDYNMGVTDWPWDRLTQAQLPARRAEYELAIALLEARLLDLQATRPPPAEAAQVEETLQMLRALLVNFDQASADLHRGEDLAWIETPFGYAGWSPMHLAVPQRYTQRDPSYQSGLRAAARYDHLVRERGFSPLRAVVGLGVYTAGEFVGVTQLLEAARGQDLVTGQELTATERVMRGVVGVIQVASLVGGGGGPRISNWAARVRGAEVRLLVPRGPGLPVPVIVMGEGVAPLALSAAETRALTQAGVLNLAMMSTGGGGSTPPGGGSTPPTGGSGPTPASGGGGGRIPGSTDAEHAIDEYLRRAGSRVEANAAEGVAGAGRQGDRLVDGALTEYKTLSGVANTTPDGLSGAFASRVMDGRGQAGRVLVDVRPQAGMTREIAERGVRRAFGADAARPSTTRGPIDAIRVIGDGFDFTVPRQPRPSPPPGPAP